VVLPAGASSKGTVVDSGGHPVGGASVVIGAADPMRRVEAMVEEGGAPDAETSADGWFRVGAAAARGHRSRGHGRGLRRATRGRALRGRQRAADRRCLRIVLSPTSRLTGRVVDREQHPLAGVQVACSIERRARDMALHAVGSRESVTTDDDGRFALRDLAEGIVHVLAYAEGYQPGELEVADRAGRDALDLELVLLPGAVSGRVLDSSGAPVAGAQVGVASGRGGPHALSDAEGVYRLDGVAPGKRMLMAYDPRGRRATKEVEVASGETTADLVFGGGASVSGVVVDRDGCRWPRRRSKLSGGRPASATS
jgi:hypothetical protein